jgi:hypothetical protein
MKKKHKINHEFGEKWIEGLRSAQYDQTTGKLRAWVDDHYCFCANGVAYLANGFEFASDTAVIFEGRSCSGFNSMGDLPISAELFEEIVQLNDIKEKSFSEIADWIKANVEFI